MLVFSDFIYWEWLLFFSEIFEESFVRMRKWIVLIFFGEVSKFCYFVDKCFYDFVLKSVFIMWLDLEKDKMKNLIWVKYLLLKKIKFFKEIVDKELDWKENFDDLGL